MDWENIKRYIKDLLDNLVFWKKEEENYYNKFLYTTENDFIEIWEDKEKLN